MDDEILARITPRQFAFFSGAYLGVGQHFIYNVAFTRAFGKGTDLVTALKKVVADSTVHVPMIYLPLYYPFKTVMLGEGSAMDGLNRYRSDAPKVLPTYWSTWPAVHLCNFVLTPVELRVGVVAGVSFMWLIYLSYASHQVADNASGNETSAGSRRVQSVSSSTCRAALSRGES